MIIKFEHRDQKEYSPRVIGIPRERIIRIEPAGSSYVSVLYEGGGASTKEVRSWHKTGDEVLDYVNVGKWTRINKRDAD